MVRHRSAQLRFIVNRACVVPGNQVGLVPALLGLIQTFNKRLCQHRLVDVHADAGLLRRHRCEHNIVSRRSQYVAGLICRAPRQSRTPIVDRGHGAGIVQTEGLDPVGEA